MRERMKIKAKHPTTIKLKRIEKIQQISLHIKAPFVTEHRQHFILVETEKLI